MECPANLSGLSPFDYIRPRVRNMDLWGILCTQVVPQNLEEARNSFLLTGRITTQRATNTDPVSKITVEPLHLLDIIEFLAVIFL